jgi:hypothetical protein
LRHFVCQSAVIKYDINWMFPCSLCCFPVTFSYSFNFFCSQASIWLSS